MKKIIAILGPTATGKTDLSLELAKKFRGELISCDSRQVYIGLDIGTGKLPGKELEVKKYKRNWEIDGVKIWMYDVVSPQKQYTVANYITDTKKIINDVLDRGKLPIIVGGTGFYLKALLQGIPSLDFPIDQKLREKLSGLSLLKLQEKLKQLSPNKWNSLNSSDKQNPRRLIRSIELVSMYPYKKRIKNYELRIKNENILKIGLTAPRDVLYKSVDDRVIVRMKMGMIDEAKKLHKKGLSFKRMRQLGLEYGVLADFLQKKIKSEEELIKTLQFKIHGFVRRQLTWFKKEENVNWFDITKNSYQQRIEKIIIKWYYNEIKDRSGQIGR